MKVILVEPDTAARPVEIEKGIHAMQEIVGGFIEAIYPWEDSVALICNEEGKIDGLPLNRVLEDYDIIAGTFFICGIEEEGFCSLTDQQMKEYQQKFQFPERFVDTPDGLVVVQLIPWGDPEKKTKKQPDYER